MKRPILNKDRFNQKLLFEGLERDRISFTDIDFIQEIKGELLIVGDVKVEGQQLPTGQRLLIERLCNKDWKSSFGVVVEHNLPPNQDILLKDTIVRKVYHKKKWTTLLNKNITFQQLEEQIKKNYV